MSKKKNKNSFRKQPIKQAIGLDYKSLLRLFLTKYDDSRDIYEVENSKPFKSFYSWLDELKFENVCRLTTEKNILKKKIGKCVDEAISLVFNTYHTEYPEKDFDFYQYVTIIVNSNEKKQH